MGFLDTLRSAYRAVTTPTMTRGDVWKLEEAETKRASAQLTEQLPKKFPTLKFGQPVAEPMKDRSGNAGVSVRLASEGAVPKELFSGALATVRTLANPAGAGVVNLGLHVRQEVPAELAKKHGVVSGDLTTQNWDRGETRQFASLHLSPSADPEATKRLAQELKRRFPDLDEAKLTYSAVDEKGNPPPAREYASQLAYAPDATKQAVEAFRQKVIADVPAAKLSELSVWFDKAGKATATFVAEPSGALHDPATFKAVFDSLRKHAPAELKDPAFSVTRGTSGSPNHRLGWDTIPFEKPTGWKAS